MPLPKSFTTVTTLSKTLAMILFIMLPFLGFYLGIQFEKRLNPQASISTPNHIPSSQKPTSSPILTYDTKAECEKSAGNICGYVTCAVRESDKTFEEICGVGFKAGFQALRATPTPTTLMPPKEGVACTQDAKECPDGSFVSRIAPNCEFAACPE